MANNVLHPLGHLRGGHSQLSHLLQRRGPGIRLEEVQEEILLSVVNKVALKFNREPAAFLKNNQQWHFRLQSARPMCHVMMSDDYPGVTPVTTDKQLTCCSVHRKITHS